MQVIFSLVRMWGHLLVTFSHRYIVSTTSLFGFPIKYNFIGCDCGRVFYETFPEREGSMSTPVRLVAVDCKAPDIMASMKYLGSFSVGCGSTRFETWCVEIGERGEEPKSARRGDKDLLFSCYADNRASWVEKGAPVATVNVDGVKYLVYQERS